MPEEKPETGVNAGTVDPPTTDTQPQAVKSPAESIPVQPKEEKPGHIPYPRFKEVNDTKKSLETQVAELQRQLAGRKEAPSEIVDPEKMEKEAMSKAVEKLVSNGMAPQAAAVFAEVFKDLARKEGKKLRPEIDEVKSKLNEFAEKGKTEEGISKWQADFRKSHKDYDEYDADMTKKWEELDGNAQRALVASPKAYELLYSSVKADRLEAATAKAREEGRQETYGTRTLKSAVSSTPGSTAKPGQKVTAEDVAGMSLKEYKDNREKILKDLGVRK
jgi:hypothetical protein